jgi:hypothetical protein
MPVIIWLLAVVLFGAIGIGGQFVGLWSYSYFAPKYEAVRRDTMIQSRAYSEASTREMYHFKLQYAQAKSQDERDTIKAFALHEATSFDRDRLPTDLQAFLIQLEQG